jgi:hypothetical protein
VSESRRPERDAWDKARDHPAAGRRAPDGPGGRDRRLLDLELPAAPRIEGGGAARADADGATANARLYSSSSARGRIRARCARTCSSRSSTRSSAQGRRASRIRS